MPAHGLMFHHLHGGSHPFGQGSITAGEFAAILKHQAALGRLRSAQEWMELADAGQLGENDMCVTFDDNLRCQFDLALPVLEAMGLTAFWFVYTAPLEGRPVRLELYWLFRSSCFAHVDEFYAAFFKALASSPCGKKATEALVGFRPQEYLSEHPFYTENDRRFRFVRDVVLGPTEYDDVMDAMMAACSFRMDGTSLWMDEACLRQLEAGGHVVGLHSHTHPTTMGELAPEDQAREFQANHAVLSGVLRRPPMTMSHPSNSYSSATLPILRSLGIRLGFRADMECRGASELEHPREDCANILKRLGS